MRSTNDGIPLEGLYGPDRITEQCHAAGPLAAWVHAATGCARAQHALRNAQADLDSCVVPHTRAFSSPAETSDGSTRGIEAAAQASAATLYGDLYGDGTPAVLTRSLSDPFPKHARRMNEAVRSLSPIAALEGDGDDCDDGIADNGCAVEHWASPNPYEAAVPQRMISSSSLRTVLTEATATTARGFTVPVNRSSTTSNSAGYEVAVELAPPSSSGYEVPTTQAAPPPSSGYEVPTTQTAPGNGSNADAVETQVGSAETPIANNGYEVPLTQTAGYMQSIV